MFSISPFFSLSSQVSPVCDGAAALYQSMACCGGDAETETACVAKDLNSDLRTSINTFDAASVSLHLGGTEDGMAKNLKAKRLAALSTLASPPSTLSMQGQYYENSTFTNGAGEVFYPFMFCKTLPHDTTTGFCKKTDVDVMLNLLPRDPSMVTDDEIDMIPAGTTSARKLELPFGGRGENLVGNSPRHTHVAPFMIRSTKQLFGMVETWAMAVFRDVKFQDWETNADLNTFISYMNTLDNDAPKIGGVITTQSVFRGVGVDELVGGFTSQFLLQPFNYGNIPIEQKYESEMDAPESNTASGWLLMQNGMAFTPTPKEPAKFTYNMRVVGSKVHNDPLYQFYYNAALVALQCGASPVATGSTRSSSWTDGGGPMIFSAIAGVARGALQTGWWHKWNAHMRIRPEVYAARMQLCSDDPTTCSAIGLMSRYNSLPANIKNIITNKNNAAHTPAQTESTNLRLLMQYPEGSPTHPSWPAGHATVAGACITVLKAFLNLLDENNNRLPWSSTLGTKCPVKMTDDGNTLEDVVSPDAITIAGELNKLASNVALGRNMAGVHFRSDGDEGIALGEQYAITYLQQLLHTISLKSKYNEFKLSKFDGTVLRITPTSTHVLKY